MRRNSFVTTLALLALLATASVVRAAPPVSSPFTGTWLGQDVLPEFGGDGSMQHLVVKGGNNVQVDYQDEWGQACWDAGSTDLWLSTDLRATVSGNTMTGVFRSAKCGHVALDWKGQVMVWTFNSNGNTDPSDDTLSDGVVTWRRV